MRQNAREAVQLALLGIHADAPMLRANAEAGVTSALGERFRNYTKVRIRSSVFERLEMKKNKDTGNE